MAQPRNKAVIAGLAAALTLGGVTLPAVATTSNTTTSDSDPNGMGTPLPSDYDKSDYYEGTEGASTFASVRSASTLSPVSLTDEMKYFTLYESGRNYDKGLSSGDGYNAVGYYQFDRRYALVPFLRQVYAYNPQTYNMFVPVLAQASTLASESYSMYDYNTRQLTALAQQLNEAWHAAYAANPAEFSALQDSYAYNNYYLPVQSMLINTYGVDLRNRADCVKGLAWSMCNLFGQGGVQKFFKGANLSNDMTDRELVTALCDTVVNRVAEWYPSQPQYHAGWQNRFRKEKAQCLKYIEQHEAEQNAGGLFGDAPSADAPSADGPSAGDAGAGNQGFGSTGGAPSADVPNVNDGAAGGATSQPSVPPAANDSGSPDTPNSTPDADTGSSEGTAGGSNFESSPSGGTNAGSGSSQGSEAGSGSGVAGGGAAGGSSSTGSTAGGSSASSGTSGGAGSSAGQGASSGSASSAQGSGAAGDSSSAGTGAAGDGSTAEGKGADDGEKTDDDNKKTSDASAEQSEEDSSTDDDKKTSKTTSNAQGSTAKKTPAGDLPLTGDDAAIVVTGAVGLAVAGASFLSLAKKENASE